MNNAFLPQVKFCFTDEATADVYAAYFAKREEELRGAGVEVDYTNMLYRTAGAAAIDLLMPADVTLFHNEVEQVNLGFALNLPQGMAALLLPRSSNGKPEYRVSLSNTIGLIDSDFKHAVRANFVLDKLGALHLREGERFAQLMIVPYIKPNFELMEAEDYFREVEGTTVRVGVGFGESGK